MSQKQVHDLFKNCIQEVENKIRCKANEKAKEIYNDVADTEKEKEIQGKIDKTRNKIMELQEQEQELVKQLKRLDYEVELSNEEKSDIFKVLSLVTSKSFYSKITLNDTKVFKEIQKTKEYQNYVNWLDIRKGYEYAFKLASGIKEMRQIIFQFQSIDWKSLGIDIPPSFLDTMNVSIKDGKIVMMSLPNNK